MIGAKIDVLKKWFTFAIELATICFECAPLHCRPYEDVAKANAKCELRAQKGGRG